MNRWKLTDELREYYKPLVETFIESYNPELDIEIDLSDSNPRISPAQLQDLLEELGYENENMDTNGWELDFWITMSKENSQDIRIRGCGMTQELKLRFEE